MSRAHLALPLLASLATSAHADTAPGVSVPQPETASQRTYLGELQHALREDVGVLAAGLEALLVHDDLGAAETLYALEGRAVTLLQLTSTASPSSAGSMRALLQRILRYQERLQAHVHERLAALLPGEPTRSLFSVRGQDWLRPSFRRDVPRHGEPLQSPAERLAAMEQELVRNGGDPVRDIRALDARYVEELRSGSLAEWVQLDEGHFSITSTGARHPIVARGKPARGAGSLKLHRDTNGNVVLAVVSHASGNYKPGIGAVEAMVARLVELGIDEDKILVTSITPQSTDLVKLVLRARGAASGNLDKALIEARTQRLALAKLRNNYSVIVKARRLTSASATDRRASR